MTKAEMDGGYGQEGMCHVDGCCMEGSSKFSAGFILGNLEHFD